MEPHSAGLEKSAKSFAEWLRKHEDKVEIMCFCEEIDTGNLGLIVPKESACLLAYPESSIHENHSDMCKFEGPEDDAYQRIIPLLERWAKELRAPSNEPSDDGVGSA